MAAIDTAKGPIVSAKTNRVGVVTGDHRSILSSNSESVVIKTGGGFLHSLLVNAIGTTWTITIYDDVTTSSPGHQVVAWTSAVAGSFSGAGPFALQIPMSNGIVVVESGTAGNAVLVWS